MAGTGHDDFDALARQYWAAWSEAMAEAMRRAMPGSPGGQPPGFGSAGAFPGMPHPGAMPGLDAMPGFGAIPGMGAMPGFSAMPGMGGAAGFGAVPGFGAGAMPGWPGQAPADGGFGDIAQAWRQALAGAGFAGGPGQASKGADAHAGDGADLFARLQAQSQAWYQRMQDMAAGFAGQQPGAAEVADAWKQALGGTAADALPQLLGALRTRGDEAMAAWGTMAAPAMDALRADTASWLGVPGFGVGREHQERLQQLVAAQLEYQHASAAYQALLGKASQASQGVFERRLGELAAAGTPVESGRALFDLWIDAAEESYAEVALSQEFSDAYGGYVNAQMRVRAAVQRQVEDMTGQLGMPTRSEVDGAYRKIAQLEREVRQLRDVAAGAVATPARAGDTRTSRAAASAAKASSGARATKATKASPVLHAGQVAKPSKVAKKARVAGSDKVAKAKRAKTTKTTKAAKARGIARTATVARTAKKARVAGATTTARAVKATKAATRSRPRAVPNGFISAIPAAPEPLGSLAGARKTAKARNAAKRKR